MPRFVLVAAVLAAALVASPSRSPAQMPDFAPVELTADSAIRALDALPAVYDVAQQYEGLTVDEGDNLVDGIIGYARTEAARTELSAAVSPHGFSGYEDWVSVLQSIFHAHAYSKAKGAMQQAMQQMMNNPNIPPAQREALMQSMNQANSAVATIENNPPSPNNIAVVTAIEPRIEEAVRQMSTQD